MTAREVVVITKDIEETAFVREILNSLGCEVKVRGSVGTALRSLKGTELIFLGLDGESPAALREIRSYHPDALVLVADTNGNAEKSIKEGAFEFIEKPLSRLRLARALKNALDLMALREDARAMRQAKAPRLVIGRNRKMLKAAKQMQAAAEKSTPVLLIGEAGVGKEAMALGIHAESKRGSGPFVSVRDPALDSGAVLFGRATTKGLTPGALAKASGGTLFVQNVEAMSGDLRRKLAAFIQTGTYRPLGGTMALGADLRIICSATALEKSALLYKSIGARIFVPALRERGDDLLPLAKHFLAEVSAELDTGKRTFAKDARDYILAHQWPGNAGELKNAVKKACLLTSDSLVQRRHLASGEGNAYCSVKEFLEDKLKGYLSGMSKVRNAALFDTVTSEFERALIELVLKETGGNQLKASKLLSLNRNTLRAKIKLYNIKNGRKQK